METVTFLHQLQIQDIAIVDFIWTGVLMKRTLVVICAVMLALGLAGCGWAGKTPIIGKGKAPAPVVTKG